jgi:uncharacterized membrane protein YidH (DUF202 family)
VSDPFGSSSEPPWARWFAVALQALVCLALFWTGWRVISEGSTFVGLILVFVAAVTTVLGARRFWRTQRPTDLGLDEHGELRSPEFDYIVWIAIGVPIILIVGLLAVALTGAR